MRDQQPACFNEMRKARTAVTPESMRRISTPVVTTVNCDDFFNGVCFRENNPNE
jgi:hypothetical protein